MKAIVVDGVAEVHRGLGVAATNDKVGVLDAEAWVISDTGQGHETALPVEHVEVRPVVEVSIGRSRPGQRRRRLVNRELVERAQMH